jgi:opacity protein-like surface antigen
MHVRKLIIIATMALALAPASAFAQSWYFTPFVGANFGGSASFGDFDELDDEVEKRIDFGATLGWQPAIVGFEVDFGYSPNFFEDTVGDANFDFGDSNVTTLMGNLVVGAPPGNAVRPYGSAGLGLIRSHVSGAGAFFDELTSNDFGMNIGGGVNGQFTDNIGIRGDIRYFRSLQDNEPDDEFDLALSDFDFWRGTVGVTFRW